MSEITNGRPITCSDCACEIDWCEFCDAEDCPNAVCYRCVKIAVRENVPQPHTHKH